jgi:hypothetical protein
MQRSGAKAGSEITFGLPNQGTDQAMISFRSASFLVLLNQGKGPSRLGDTRKRVGQLNGDVPKV